MANTKGHLVVTTSTKLIFNNNLNKKKLNHHNTTYVNQWTSKTPQKNHGFHPGSFGS
jgi:hypothetical protein